MKTIIKEITKILTITLLAMMVTSCNNEGFVISGEKNSRGVK